MPKDRRKHFKVEMLPGPIVDAVNQKLTEGYTYEAVADWLSQLGHEIGKSSIQRYGHDFLTRLERLKVVKDQARAIVSSDPDAPATEMHEAANQLAVQLIMESLMQVPDLEGEKVTEIFKALALLEKSAVAREKLKYEFSKGVEAGLAKLKEELKAELASEPELLQRMIELADKAKEQVA